jgi:cobalamin-dependent methionine synthase I
LYYRKLGVDSVDSGLIRLQERVEFRAPKLAKAVKNSNELVCFIATVGKGIEQRINELIKENHLATAYILDCMGSVAVESVVEKFHRHMAKKCEAAGNGVTLRFSPGYCDWPITEQKKLFGLFESFQPDVELSDSCLMQPRKSISGVFGVLPSHLKPSASPYNPCSDCKQHSCIARRG